MSRTGCIYSITCKVNGKRYIGQTVKDLAERWKSHLQTAKTHSNRPLARAIKKYGQGMFVIRAIEEDIPDSLLNERECYWIEQFDSYNQGYNATTGGEQDFTMRDDIKEKISKTQTGVTKSEEHCLNVKKAHIERNKVNRCFEGCRADGSHHRCKVRGTHTITGEVVEFNSLTEAAKSLSLTTGNIARSIKNNYKAGGYKWEKLEKKSTSHRVYGKRILDGKIIHHFNSMREAGQVLGSGNSSGLKKALKNPSRYSWKGCRWYKEEE